MTYNYLSVFHDAGSANIGAWYIKEKKIKTKFYCKGPALKIFQSIFKNFKNEKYSKNLLKNIDIVLTGSSSKNLIEHNIRKLCIKKKTKSICFIDHWVGYKNGFTKNKEIILPNILYVTNNEAQNIAKRSFKKIKIIKIKNYYEINILNKIKKKKITTKNNNFLYFLEPIDNKIEFIALNNFINYLNKKKTNIKNNVIFKLHPSEKIKKYKNWFKKKNLKISQIKIKEKIENLLSWSDYVFGLESYALVLALKSRKKVYSMLPIGNKKLRLPFKNLNNIQL